MGVVLLVGVPDTSLYNTHLPEWDISLSDLQEVILGFV